MFSEDRGSSTARRLCVFDADDDDRRPYAVVREIGFDEGPTRAATYAVVPAGVALRVTEHTADGPDPDAPSGCGDRGTSVLIGTGAVGTDPLVADAYYTLVKHTYDTFATGSCTRGAADYCEFSSQPFDIDSPPVPCSTEGIYVFEDGSRVDGRYVAGVRVVNLTSNASRISSSVSSAMTVTHGNAAGGTAVGTEYASPFPTARARFCPDYLACDPAISGTAEANALQACTDGAAKWLLAEVTDARLAAPDRATTIYVFGYAGYLLVPRTPDFDVQIVEADLDVVIAHDITDGPL